MERQLTLLPAVDDKKVQKEVVSVLKEYRALRMRFSNDMEVTKEQLNRIYDLMDALSEEIREEKLVTHSAYEQQIYEIVPAKRGNYHFAESISQILHEGSRWPEVFEHVYGSMEKFKSYLNKK
ncbi:DUF1878 domain-containing protein [Bacillus cereus]|uniref:DUF1878 domain-containing protein n=1 Tax=Bacillus cereus TaxID=1396 RepID=UPI0014439E0F|nr:DUF1878 domain-containing protein [Bacillus cereus]NKX61502.1 DUF1878 domain-containing protein [Bacillus cereus]